MITFLYSTYSYDFLSMYYVDLKPHIFLVIIIFIAQRIGRDSRSMSHKRTVITIHYLFSFSSVIIETNMEMFKAGLSSTSLWMLSEDNQR